MKFSRGRSPLFTVEYLICGKGLVFEHQASIPFDKMAAREALVTLTGICRIIICSEKL